MIEFTYNVEFEDKNEYLQKLYGKKEIKVKQKLIKEYYKYHNEVPRWFMENITPTMSKHHDNKRKLQFHQIIKKNKKIKDERGILDISFNILTESNSLGAGAIELKT